MPQAASLTDVPVSYDLLAAYLSTRMNVATVHYHLNQGGVTQVIANHLRGLATSEEAAGKLRVAVIHGGRRQGWPEELASRLETIEPSLHEVPALDYDEGRPARPAELAQMLRSVFHRLGFAADQTVIHVHNHSLGKNVSLPGALAELAREGYGLLLQLHDFPEDFRPDDYRRLTEALCPISPDQLPSILYPQSAHIHYAVLNRRDHQILQRAGVQPRRLHLIANPVAGFGTLPDRSLARRKLNQCFAVPSDDRFVLYPVRCIRRKNVGEVLLWSALARDGTTFGFTLPPLNPRERPTYLRWKETAAQLGLPCVFELGTPAGLSFRENLAAADLLLTTSVAEGFGMVFLESWLAGRALIGRDLPEITADFVAAGLRFRDMRASLQVPIDWIGREPFQESICGAYLDTLAAYNRRAPARKTLLGDIDNLIQDKLVDFGTLNTRIQKRIIERVRSNPASRGRLRQINPWIAEALSADQEATSATLQRNAELVCREYSLGACGQKLYDVYQPVAACPRSGRLSTLPHGESILDAYLHLSRFHPIRVET